jgi:D-3-phosphoglycerate dehydrogenase
VIFLTHDPEALENYYGERALAGLRALGPVKVNPKAAPLSTPELIEAARDCRVIVSYRITPGEPALFAAAPELVAFVRCAVDIRNIAVDAASQAGVLVTQASPGFVVAVAEWVIGAMIDLARGLTRSTLAYRAGEERPHAPMGVQLGGATLGVIGYGRIAQYLCALATAFGMRILVDDPHVTIKEPDIRQVDLATVMRESDFVVCLAVATEATENLVDAAAFALMKPSAYFINASRGNLVDEAALEAVLDAQRIAGAAMDVGRAPDQMPSPRLARRPDVIATPHVAGLTPAAIEHQALETVAQVAEILQGRAPIGAVNPEHATRLARLRRNA